MLVRGPDFNSRFESRPFISDYNQNHELSADNTNGARVIELQRLLGPVAASRWLVSFIEGDEQLITNDVGFVTSQNIDTKEISLAIPLDLHRVLTIVPQKKRVVAIDKDGVWYPNIEYSSIKPGNEKDLNKTIVAGSQRFIFGSSKELIASLMLERQDIHSSKGVPEPAEIGFLSGTDARVHEFTWHKLVGFLATVIDDDTASFDFNAQALAKGWCPPIYLPENLPGFPPSLYKRDNKIVVYLYDGEWALKTYLKASIEQSAVYWSYKVV